MLVIIFNRPDLAQRMVEVLRRVRPARLYVAADGPRPGKPGEVDRCTEARAAFNHIDWPCQIERKFESVNLGCGPAVSSAISWVLTAEREAIILEDDCLPDPSFFRYCGELLERYRDDERVMQIGGSNWGASEDRFLGSSYAFTSFAPVWGWATWARAWRYFDIAIDRWPAFRDSGMVKGLPVGRRWRSQLSADWDRAHRGEGTWDHQWQFNVYQHHGLSTVPAVNLITNLGFRDDATQTVQAGDSDLSGVPSGELPFPLRHPPEVARNPLVDGVFERILLRKFGLAVSLFRRLVPSLRVRRAIKKVALAGRSR
ncbi:MAG: hypothetical protein JOY57_19210 [Actinobacteria bacterium]|nr:hypothetical protein [Actinomycetota bacterium]